MTPRQRAGTVGPTTEVRPLRIALLIERFVPGRGGVENAAWNVAHELARQGEDVSVITRDRLQPADRPVARVGRAGGEQSADDRPRCVHVDVSRRWQPWRVLSFARKTRRLVESQPYDVVHSFSRTRTQDLYRAGGGSHAAYLARLHTPLAEGARRLSPRHRVLLEIERRVFADRRQLIQCPSRFVAKDLIDRHGVDESRIRLLPNGVDLDRYANPRCAVEGARLRQRMLLDDPRAERICLFPGTGWRRKGLDLLLEALARSDDPGLRLWVAGRDTPREWRGRALRLGLENRVVFLGERSDMPALYQAADFIALPTRYDPFANVTLEAAAAGRAIVTTDTNGAAEWLAGAVDCIPSEDIASLAGSIERLRSPSEREELGRRARKRAAQLGWADHVARIREIYAEIVESRGSHGSEARSHGP